LNRSVRNAIIGFVCVLVGVVCAYAAFLYFSYISDIVVSGTAYGFRIGASKQEAYAAARPAFQGRQVYIMYPVDRDLFGPLVPIHFTEDEYAMLARRDFWEIYFVNGYWNSLSLTFEEGSLVKIYRHRQYFELP